MKTFWVDVRSCGKDCATTAIEQGADALVATEAAPLHALGRVTVIAPDGDLVPGTDVHEVCIDGKAGEEEALRLAEKAPVIVTTTDWSVIPLENLVSQSGRIIAAVRTAEEAQMALTVLERGTAGICLVTDDPAEIIRTAACVRAITPHYDLVPFTVTAISPGIMGDRVCVDTCSLMQEGEGMLIGNTSSAFLLVQAETLENPYVAPRPFRVNAGAVHAYVLMADGKTKYLSEVTAGDRVLVAREDGSTTVAMVGRVKTERRPMVLVEVEHAGMKSSLVLQNAETVRLVGAKGIAISVAALRPGDIVLGHRQQGGRHFGVAVEETIRET
ncbi:3-dehydroquinate synthase II [Methanogenium sp. S4BF]|uniref:3-dehydroquinate synthase II n=1 Tax=Methanogenium sp. S4BF TaxID=1789226 RepID=UPI002415FD00|nr:3-dehydroquinate synthase II [Methanogenium sp. S4BF]WFN33606.1 3-dehydroquinate synthase II [Methanogenium sp. S4BF]